MGELEVDELNDYAIEACNDLGQIWYLIISTNLGFTKIMEYGPCTPDFKDLPETVICNFSRIEYDEKKIAKRINEFVNSPKRNITQARQIDRDVAFGDCIDIIQYMKNRDNF